MPSPVSFVRVLISIQDVGNVPLGRRIRIEYTDLNPVQLFHSKGDEVIGHGCARGNAMPAAVAVGFARPSLKGIYVTDQRQSERRLL
jgi:hypothetical protein